ncbi:MAG TPA: cytochrome c [Flavobacteriaceae bacterium]|nr:cytochrome c [Flavobacteriaceae bacterium]
MRIFLFSFLLVFFLSSCKNSSEKQKENYVISAGNPSENPQQKNPGKAVYTNFCMQCHLANGQGVPNIYPALAGSDWLSEKRTKSIHAVKYGLSGEIKVNGKTYDNVMLPLGLTDQEIAEVMNYVMTSWGNTQEKPVTEEEVSAIKE